MASAARRPPLQRADTIARERIGVRGVAMRSTRVTHRVSLQPEADVAADGAFAPAAVPAAKRRVTSTNRSKNSQHGDPAGVGREHPDTYIERTRCEWSPRKDQPATRKHLIRNQLPSRLRRSTALTTVQYAQRHGIASPVRCARVDRLTTGAGTRRRRCQSTEPSAASAGNRHPPRRHSMSSNTSRGMQYRVHATGSVRRPDDTIAVGNGALIRAGLDDRPRQTQPVELRYGPEVSSRRRFGPGKAAR
jgi:hypothetical protein